MSITAISQDDIHRITSSQVITDLTTAVKELVENSLDAHANAIEIVFNNYGLNSFEVSDNGDGISGDDFEGIALKHHTSKIANFDDISRVKTLGFRGEALNSLCSLGNVKVVTTKTPPKANSLEFDNDGKITLNKICSRQKGTSVSISNLFHSLPVRKKDFTKNHKREFSKCISVLQAYCIINTGVKFSIFNINNKNKKQLVLKTQGSQQMKDNLLNIFGSTGTHGLIPIEMKLDLNEFKGLSSFKMDTTQPLDYKITITGLISKNSNGFGRPTNDRQYIYINKRPITFNKLNKLLTEVYRFYNLNQSPCFMLNVDINPSFFDVNVTPDKRTILLHNEGKVIEVLKAELVEFYDGLDYNLSKNTSVQTVLSQRYIGEENEEEEEEQKGLTFVKDIRMADMSHVQDLIEEDKNQQTQSIGDEKAIEEDHAGEELPTFRSSYQLSQKPLAAHSTYQTSQELFTTKSSYTPSQELFVQETDQEEEEEEEADPLATVELTQQEQEEFNALQFFREENAEREEAQAYDDDDDDDEDDQDASDVEDSSQQSKHTLQLNSSVPIKKPKLTQSTLPIPHSQKKINSIHDLGSFRNPSSYVNPGEKLKKLKQQTLENVSISCNGDVIEEECVDVRDGALNFVEDENYSDKEEAADEEDEDDDEENDHENCHHSHEEADDEDLEPTTVPKDGEDLQILSVGLAKPKLGSLKNKTELTLNYFTSLKIPERMITYDDLISQTIKFSQLSRKQQVELDDIENQESSEQLLTLTVSKKDFLDMKIVGQFNLGFILVMRDSKDLFIVDQHASDEKYNFEDLNKTTIFQSQYLVKGLVLELTVMDESTVIDNQEVFNKNGFKFKINEYEPPGSRIELTSIPVSKKTIFDVSDFHELIHLIKENPGSQTDSIRCSKIRSMFAMRACRKSIMVGKPLNMKTMTRVVRNLAGLEKPWNCPHGRPAMRHLMELKQWETFNDDYKI